ncbi:hypothetical protein [Teredinibacter sp. KSP-S5-2]|uniref:hypothetical protein n=1 Tax=Teredinibacter sp. KSP-S5-2 TaxID=3034506 RepID=UPI0029346516|nr:hypothetical protein [Teredinibacter sp. KSP-S5-2]WNO10854.1 hypothetical protein P5V12_06660 [Teredinibacter sp. KSP-S5-2]
MISSLPNDPKTWRDQLYQGKLYKLSPSPKTINLVREVNSFLQEIFALDNLTQVHKKLDEDDFFQAMKTIRKNLYEGKKYRLLLTDVLVELGYSEGEIAYEPLRLRAIRHNGHLNPRAKAVYYPHRDTWYSHGQSLIVGWIPLHDQTEEQTFEIYPEWYKESVPNNSEVFDFDQWRENGSDRKIGWQKKSTGLTAVYPEATETVPIKEIVKFGAKTGEQLLFSGAHFHKTREQTNDLTRFSVDYRFVHLGDHQQGIGAPNADNRSRGCAVKDYIRL